MPQLLQAAVAVSLFVTSASAYAQREPAPQPFQRPDQPATLAAPPPAMDPSMQILADFRSAYRQAGSPRITVFWNRAFSDEADTQYEDYTRFDSQTRTSGEASGERFLTRDGVAAVADSEGKVDTRGEIRSGRERLTDPRTSSSLSRSADIEMEQAFTGLLRSGGINLVDRTTIMRATGAQATDKGAVQQIESEALLAKSDIVLEVTQVDDSERPDGIGYRVIARDLKSARVLMDFMTAAQPASVLRPYVAGSRGFVRAPEPIARPRDVGRQLGLEAIEGLREGF